MNELEETIDASEPRTPSPSAYLKADVKKIDEQYMSMTTENITMASNDEEILIRGPTKRDREDQEGEWKTVTKEKKIKKLDKIEVYVSSKDRMPKQFALAKLFRDLKITEIIQIKYLNPFKIRVEFENEWCAENMITCKDLIDKGWNFQKSLQVSFTYGTIKDVDLDLSNEDILKKITCDSRATLASAIRLNRRSAKGDWLPSETVRLAFKGSFLPAHVCVDGLRIKVDPYVFPVSQCSKCWRLGHTRSRCPSEKATCPKCSGKHENCDTNIFVCVNCKGDHMALNKTACPMYLKEKKIREIMSQRNCTYRKARTLYAPNSPPERDIVIEPFEFPELRPSNTISAPPVFSPILSLKSKQLAKPVPSFSDVVTFQAEVHSDINSRESKRTIKPKNRNKQEASPGAQQRPKKSPEWIQDFTPSYNKTEQIQDTLEEERGKKRDVTFGELLSRLKEIVFVKNLPLQEKIMSVIKCCAEWLILIIVECISEWPFLKSVLEYGFKSQ